MKAGGTYRASLAVAGLFLLIGARPASAGLIVGFDPSVSIVSEGDAFTVDLQVRSTSLIPDGVSIWALEVGFDPSVVSFTGATFDPLVWDPGTGFLPLDSGVLPGGFGADEGAGIVGLSAGSASLAFPFEEAIGATPVTLATLEFSALAAGTTDLGIDSNAFDPFTEGFFNGFGFSVDPAFQVETGSVLVASKIVAEPIPEPTTVLLFVAGLGLVGGGARRRRRQA